MGGASVSEPTGIAHCATVAGLEFVAAASSSDGRFWIDFHEQPDEHTLRDTPQHAATEQRGRLSGPTLHHKGLAGRGPSRISPGPGKQRKLERKSAADRVFGRSLDDGQGVGVESGIWSGRDATGGVRFEGQRPQLARQHAVLFLAEHAPHSAGHSRYRQRNAGRLALPGLLLVSRAAHFERWARAPGRLEPSRFWLCERRAQGPEQRYRRQPRSHAQYDLVDQSPPGVYSRRNDARSR